MADLTIKKFLGIIIALSLSLNILMASAARMDINSLDYDQLMALLASEQEEGGQAENYPDADDAMVPSETNEIPVEVAARNGKRVSSNLDFTITKPSASAVLAPHVEILHIVESFLRLKGEMATRAHALINDNFDLFRSIYNVIVSKTATLHSFTLTGISVIRRILEFAVQMIGTWEVNAPSASVNVNKVFSILG